MHLPQLIPEFQHFLWVLKVTHSGADLDTAMTMASGLMDEDLRWVIQDILNNRNEWWVPGKIVDARQRLADYWKVGHSCWITQPCWMTQQYENKTKKACFCCC